MMSEVPKEVQFCSAILSGDAKMARRLLQEPLFEDLDKKEASSLIIALLKNIVRVTSIEARNVHDEQQAFINLCCVEALAFILDDKNPAHIDSTVRSTAHKIYSRLTSLTTEAPPQLEQQYVATTPDCVQKLVSVLNQEKAHEAEKAYLCASRNPRTARLGKLTKQITNSIQRSYAEQNPYGEEFGDLYAFCDALRAH